MSWRLRYAPHLGFPTSETPWLHYSAASLDPVDQIAAAADLGFVAVCDKDLVARDPQDQTRIGAALRRYGMTLGSVAETPAAPLRPWGSANPADEAALREGLQYAVAAASRAGAQFIIVTAQRSPDLPADRQCAIFIDHLDRWAADDALSAGVKLCIEPISPSRLADALITSVAESQAIIAKVGRTRVGLVFDTVHVAAEGDDLLESFARAKDDIAVMQLADLPGRVEPGAGALDLLSLLRALKDAHYEALVELEHVHSEPGLAGEQLSLARLQALDDRLGPGNLDRLPRRIDL